VGVGFGVLLGVGVAFGAGVAIGAVLGVGVALGAAAFELVIEAMSTGLASGGATCPSFFGHPARAIITKARPMRGVIVGRESTWFRAAW
jgi:hypothetical protein